MSDRSITEIMESIDSRVSGFLQSIQIEEDHNLVRELRELVDSNHQEMKAMRMVGLPQFVTGDLVQDIYGKTFYVSSGSLTEGDNGIEWHYRMGAYYVPESDLQLIAPRQLKVV